MASLSEELACLSKATERLNKSTGELTAEIGSLEQKLAAMNVGIEDWLDVCIRDRQGTKEETPSKGGQPRYRLDGFALGYCKIGSSWRIAVKKIEVVVEVTEPEGFEEVDRITCSDPFPLINASRVIRAQASLHLEALVSSLIKRVRHTHRRVETGKSILDKAWLSEQAPDQCSESSETGELQD